MTTVVPLHARPHPKVPMPRVGTVTHQPIRARLILRFDEGHGMQNCTENGWAAIDGPWVLWLSDESDPEQWQSWPIQHVVCVDWLTDGAS